MRKAACGQIAFGSAKKTERELRSASCSKPKPNCMPRPRRLYSSAPIEYSVLPPLFESDPRRRSVHASAVSTTTRVPSAVTATLRNSPNARRLRSVSARISGRSGSPGLNRSWVWMNEGRVLTWSVFASL